MEYIKSKNIAYTAIGIALYVCLSMTVKIPVIGHIGLDLGYIVLAIYCLKFGALYGAIVGGVGCTFVSLITSGWFPPGWLLGNLFIGAICGKFYKRENIVWNIILTVVSVFVGVAIIKTVVECGLYSIPFSVKFSKNIVAFTMDAVTMSVGVVISENILNKYDF